MNNHFGFCFTDALTHFIFHGGKIEWQFSELPWGSFPRVTLARPWNIMPVHWVAI